jgi:eukaryotic-like serine/threonine-protein kinase
MTAHTAPDRLGHFRIVSKLGAGGMGIVYRARDEQLARDVALKVLPAESFTDPTARARLLREARSAAALNHPYICSVYEVGEENGTAFIAMELVEGRPLSDILAGGPLRAAALTKYGVQLAEALEHAHGRGIVHRDLKSANIVVNDEDRAKILDFGLAKPFHDAGVEDATRTSASLTEVGVVSGTLAYMAPEQLRGVPADARSDIWALGVVLHEMASGARPFRADTGFALSSAILNDPPAALPAAIPVEVRAVIDRCLEKDPARRYQSASEVAGALRAVQAGTTGAWVTWRYRLMRSPYTPVAAAMLAIVVAVGYLGREWVRVQLGGAPRVPSLAVLPFENLSHDPDQEFLAAGLHEALITELSGLRGVRIIQRASLRRYQNTKKSPAEIARELGNVEAIVTGGVLRSGGRVRVTMHLVRASTEEPLWDGKYERELTDVLSLQNEVTGAIASELKVRLDPDKAARYAKPARKVNPATFELIAKARFFANKVTPEGFQKAHEYIDEAIRTDPNEPLAWAARASVYSLMAHQLIPGTQEKAGPPARRALELDPTLAEAHYAVAQTKMYFEWDLEGAAASYRRAIELNPNLPDAHAHYAWYWQSKDRGSQRALDEISEAKRLDPLDALFPQWKGNMLIAGKRPDDALVEARQSLDLDPANVAGYIISAEAYRMKRMFAAQMEMARKAVAVSPMGEGVLVTALWDAGRKDEARQLLAKLSAIPGMDSFTMAILHTNIGEREEALKSLERAISERHIYGPWLATLGAFDPLLDDPRFKALVAKVKPLDVP